MSLSRIFVDSALAVGAPARLGEEAFRHAIQVLRLREGEGLCLFDGRGGEYLGRLEAVTRRDAVLRVERFVAVERESRLAVTLLQGVSKGERMDYAIQKAVELGVSAIVPVITERCNVKLDAERWDKKLDHWRGVAISACEQSGRTRIAAIEPPIALDSALTRVPQGVLKLTLDPLAEAGLSTLSAPESVALLIGPEGGLAEAEVALSRRRGFTPIRFGPRVLRTETAGPAVLAALQARWGDLG